MELLRNILTCLELQDKAHLAMTNRYLRAIIEPPSHEDFLQAETTEWATSKSLYVCKGCVRFRRYDQFADDMRKGRRALRGAEANTRLCLECGVRQGVYSKGIEITFKGQHAILDWDCITLTDRDARRTSCGSTMPFWNCIRIKSMQHHQDHRQPANDDDWAYSKRFYVEKRPFDGMETYWLEI
jgi:hypothetical protein